MDKFFNLHAWWLHKCDKDSLVAYALTFDTITIIYSFFLHQHVFTLWLMQWHFVQYMFGFPFTIWHVGVIVVFNPYKTIKRTFCFKLWHPLFIESLNYEHNMDKIVVEESKPWLVFFIVLHHLCYVSNISSLDYVGYHPS